MSQKTFSTVKYLAFQKDISCIFCIFQCQVCFQPFVECMDSKVPNSYNDIKQNLQKKNKPHFFIYELEEIDHFTVVCLVAWPLNENEAGGDLVLIET